MVAYRIFLNPKALSLWEREGLLALAMAFPFFCRNRVGEIASILLIPQAGKYTVKMFTNEFEMSPRLLIWRSLLFLLRQFPV